MKHPAERTPADRTLSAKRRRTGSSFKQGHHSLDPGRVPVLADLPEPVLLQVFKRLGLDRLTALQGICSVCVSCNVSCSVCSTLTFAFTWLMPVCQGQVFVLLLSA